MLLLRNKDQQQNNTLAILQPASAGKWVNCALITGWRQNSLALVQC